MGTDLHYNGVILRNVLTREFSQSPIRDESGTDLWHWKFLIRIETVVNPEAAYDGSLGVTGLPDVIGNDNVANVMAALRHALGQDRKNLLYTMQGDTVLQSNTQLDCNNGPKVVHLNVLAVSPKTIRIEFAVEVCSIECIAGANYPGGGPSAVVSNRWSCTDDIDEMGLTTRYWRGKLRVSHSVNNPQTFRGLCVPPLVRGFRRKSMHFTSEPNSLELAYDVADEELLGQAAPFPAIRMSATHTESAGLDATESLGDVRIRLDGPKGADKHLMLQRAQQIAVTKLQVRNPSGKCQILQMMFTDHMSDNENAVEVHMRVRHTPPKGTADIVGWYGSAIIKKFGQPFDLPEYDPHTATFVGPYGTASLVGLFACYLQSPCSSDHGMPQPTSPEPKSDEKKRDSRNKTQYTYTEGPIDSNYDNPGYSIDHLNAIYQFYQIDSRILKSYNRNFSSLSKVATETANTATIASLAPPTAKRIVKVSGERLGAWPVIFRDEDFVSQAGIIHAIMEFEPVPRAPKLSSDGKTFLYAIDATYVYGLSRAPTPGEALPVGSLPWDRSISAEHAFPPAAFIPPISPKGLQ